MPVDVILGLQWGDEGKGKIVDFLAPNYKAVARFQGGPNAGHTLKFDGQKFVLHTIPSGIFREGLLNIIGNGVVLDPITLRKEAEQLDAIGLSYKSRLLISRKAHLILPTHRLLDAASEASKGKEKIGSTLKGIGPTYMDKTGRNGLRVGDLEEPDFKSKYEKLKAKHLEFYYKVHSPLVFDLDQEEEKWFSSLSFLREFQLIDGEYYVDAMLRNGDAILAEGAQGSMLDIDFGTYPFVTSSNTLTSGVCSGLGIAPKHIREVLGITKAYCTRVGSGPFPTELHNAVGDHLRQKGFEFGSTTGRPRRCGWIDLVQLKYAIMLNGVTQLIMTKIDVLDNMNSLSYCNAYEVNGKLTEQLPYNLENSDLNAQYATHIGWPDKTEGSQSFDQLPEAAVSYINTLEAWLKVPFSMISTGPERESLIVRS